MDDATARGNHMVVDLIDDRSTANHEREFTLDELDTAKVWAAA
jgi:hypothetical protein